MEICRDCGALYEASTEESKCPACEERRERAERGRWKLEEIKKSKDYLIEMLESKEAKIQERIERAKELPLPYKENEGLYAVLSSQGGKYYECDLLHFTCSCEDYQRRKAKSNGEGAYPCKHLLRIGLLIAEEREGIRKHSEEAKAKIEAKRCEAIADRNFYK